MRLLKLDIAATLVFLAFGIWVLIQAADYGVSSQTGPGSGTFPLVAGLLIAIFSVLNLVRAATGNSPLKQEDALNMREIQKSVGIIVLIFLYIYAFGYLGAFLPLPFLMIGISLIIHWRVDPRWLAILAAFSLGLTVACYFIFEVFLNVLLPQGPLGF